nr:glycosyltransferase [Kibdelosporangium sp. MJ126-NF4]CEL23063.1 N-acetyl-glucosamine transferase [Kibdelosporangium sp. MJ126-NF4]CTQ90201.1 N-acetyl-glucosamine transferase [Kibdelosporangium sp. MJ126-NF4]
MHDSTFAALLGLTQAIALIMSVTFITYVYLIVVPYLRRKPAPEGDPSRFDWHFIVPCRDEEAVVEGTVRYLRSTFPACHVWVVDDASTDRTADIVTRLLDSEEDSSNLHLVRRVLPEARTGKGDALNAAYREIGDWAGPDADPGRTVVVVIDADGRPAANCLTVCSADHLFGNPDVGAVQIDVRMSNREVGRAGKDRSHKWFGRTLVRMQDLEFRTAIAAIQTSRRYTGTISMGGNGQFTRMSALDSIAGPTRAPWRGCLLEDFEIGVHLLIEGWRTEFSMDTHVDQEGLYSLRRFLVQRTRWGQGTMQCARYVRIIWASNKVTTLGAAELLYYLAQPWMQLIGTIVYPIPMILLAGKTVRDPVMVWEWFSDGAWILFAIYGSFGILPFLIWGPIYWWKCERTGTFLRGIGYGCCYAAYIYTFYITSWRAFIRLVRGHNGWAKTRRNNEVTTNGVTALES